MRQARSYVVVLLFFVVLYGAAYASRLWLTPGVLPLDIGESISPRLTLAFVIKCIENIGIAGTVISLVFGVAWSLAAFMKRRSPAGS